MLYQNNCLPVMWVQINNMGNISRKKLLLFKILDNFQYDNNFEIIST